MTKKFIVDADMLASLEASGKKLGTKNVKDLIGMALLIINDIASNQDKMCIYSANNVSFVQVKLTNREGMIRDGYVRCVK